MNAEAMTERFEMRLSQSVLEQVDAWRGSQGDLPSRSEAVRRLVEAALASERKGKRVKLSDGNKLIVVMLCELFKHLKLKGGEIDPAFVETAIFGGHYWGLEWQYPGIFEHREDYEDVVKEVVDVLDMWRFLERGVAGLSKKEKERIATEAEPFGKHVVFTGFDSNSESAYNGVARFMIEELDRFAEFKGRELNAHMPTLETYRRMLSLFEPIRRSLMGRELTTSEITEILKAKLHPSQRKEMSEARKGKA